MLSLKRPKSISINSVVGDDVEEEVKEVEVEIETLGLEEYKASLQQTASKPAPKREPNEGKEDPKWARMTPVANTEQDFFSAKVFNFYCS